MWILLYQFLGALIYIDIQDLEAVWIDITVKLKTILIDGLNRTPYSNTDYLTR